MPAVFGSSRTRIELTGLEEPDELWERLKEANAQATALAANNKRLVSRVRLLERRLADVGALTDDELVAELPKRMSRALESAQGVATEIVRRARRQEATIRQKAEETAAEIVRKAESQALAILRNAGEDGAARVAAAESRAVDIVSAAQRRREAVIGELEAQAGTLRRRIKVLERSHTRLIQAYDVVEQTLAEARNVLGGPEGDPGVKAMAATNGSNGTRRREQEGGAEEDTATAQRAAARFQVYDWSPSAVQAG